jgi:hypothetical protein
MAASYKATPMKPVDINAMSHTKSDSTPQFREVADGRTKQPNMPKKGSDPKASMFDGPFGGKKPQS